ncbi:MAG: YggT family protein [Dehalococcoidia bacterium]|nr:MAG: YggT family protein [Dehalococcoidia bacterium]
METLITFIEILTWVLTALIFFRAILSWFPIDPRNPLVTLLYEVTEPILAPMRNVIPRIGMIDISPLVAIILIQIIGQLLVRELS